MRDCYLSFSTVDEIREFVSLATRQSFPIEIEHGSHRASATAIMSLFCMGLHTPVHVVAPNVPESISFFTAIASYGAAVGHPA